MKASNVTTSKTLAKEKPDLEEAVEESDDADMLEDNSNEGAEDLDLSKDKYVKQPKKKYLQKTLAQEQKGKTQKESLDDGSQGNKVKKESKKGKGKRNGKVSSRRN